MNKPGTLFGPFGTELLKKGKELGIGDLSDPVKILNGGVYAQATQDIAKQYVAAGANHATTNTYGLRKLVRAGDEYTYFKAADRHAQIVADATRGKVDRVWFSIGTYGNGYDPTAAPSVQEAMEFHKIQLIAVRQFAEANPGIPVGALFETISAVREAIAIAKLANSLDFPVIASFVTDARALLFDDTPVNEAVSEVDATSDALFGYSVNCCPIEALGASVRLLGENRSRLKMAYPNAESGDPRHLDGCTHVVGVHDSAENARQLVAFAHATPSVQVIGGCCGYSPEDIANINQAMSEWHFSH
jgi:S-methylmethionine-dependent homocysteine/selenocysteine methylase